MINMSIQPEAARWYKEEMDLNEGDRIQFFVKLYGKNPIHPNYSLGIARNEPLPAKCSFQSTVEGITFCVSEDDAWFFKGHQCDVMVKEGEVDYVFDGQ